MRWLSIVVSLHCFLEKKSEQTFKAKAKRLSLLLKEKPVCYQLQQHSLSTYVS